MFTDGTEVVCSEDHRWLFQHSRGGQNRIWRKTSDLKQGDRIVHLVSPWDSDTSYRGGYLAGVFDGEGCIVTTGRRDTSDILFAQNQGPVLDKVKAYMEDLSFALVNNRGGDDSSICQQWVLRGIADSMRFLGAFRPARLLEKSKYIWEGRALRSPTSQLGRDFKGVGVKIIASIEPLPERDLIDIETGTHTFIANGLVSHNCQFYDEGAHMVATGVSRSMQEVYDAATPALDQFKEHAFLYSGSSPWTMDGRFYELVQQTLSVEADTGEPVYPANLMIQLPSWDIYEDWERSHILLARPGWERPVPADKFGPILGPDGEPIIETAPELHYGRLRNAIQTYDASMQKLERANPETFAVERRARWATAMDAYIPKQHVDRMFNGWPTPQDTLVMTKTGSPTTDYVMHGDPGQTGSNFGFAVAHKVAVPGSDFPHVVFDYIKAWQPGDFDPMEMNYLIITEEIGKLIDGFMPTDVTFDQWNSISMIQTLQVRANQHFKRANVYERSATAPINWRTAETFKTALSLNLVHAPYYELADLECRFLRKMPGDKVDHPTTGPCTTKDVYDAMSIVVFKLLGEEVAAFLGQQLSGLELQGTMPGLNSTDQGAHLFDAFSAFGGQTGGPTRPSPARSGAPVIQPGRLSRTPGSPRVPRQPQRRR